MKTENKERVFSVELKSKSQLKNVTLTNSKSEIVLVEGTLGKLVKASFEENVVLEVTGTKGTLHLDLREDEIRKHQKTHKVKNSEAS
jgi:hypothetical protein